MAYKKLNLIKESNMQHKVTKKQPLLDSAGNIAEVGYSTSLVWEYDRNAIKAKKIRIKEWDYYLISNQRYALCLTVADNGFAGAISASIVDFEKQFDTTKTEISLFPMGKMGFPSSSEVGNINATIKGATLNFDNDGKTRRLYGSMPKFYKGQTLSVDITLSNFPKESMVIATPFSKKKHFYYNQKINCMYADGYFQLGDEKYTFSKKDSLGTLDWGRGVWTYDNTWYWGSLQAILDDKSLFGFNIGYGFGNNTAATENMLFYNGKAHKLDEIEFHIPQKNNKDDFLSPWRITSNDNRLELDFEPILDRQAPLNLGIIMMMPHQVFGKFSGKAILDDKSVIEIKNLIGFAEKVRNKW